MRPSHHIGHTRGVVTPCRYEAGGGWRVRVQGGGGGVTGMRVVGWGWGVGWLVQV